MLEKKIFCDAHFHFTDSLKFGGLDRNFKIEKGCASCHSLKEAEDCISQGVIFSFGIHPQNLDINLIRVLETLLLNKKHNGLCAIGECGFDFYTPELKASSELQKKMFSVQVELAQENNLPLVIHCRKANEMLFENTLVLRKLPAVLFHSFMGSLVEAESLIKKGINGYFSFGKQIFNGNKNAVSCVKNLPIERLLLETDAPYQFLKGERFTKCSEIEKIYFGAYELRNEKKAFEDFTENLYKNFKCLYGIQ
ncbi:MAG: TatD family hydrolase [Treponema sp.]|nr:TatD family hydrolase [Treponema sp.]